MNSLREGRKDEGHKAAEMAVWLARDLAESGETQCCRASAENALGCALLAKCDWKPAIRALRRSISIRKSLDLEGFDSHSSALAGSLHNLALAYVGISDLNAATAAYSEAAELKRHLYRVGESQILPSLADTLQCLLFSYLQLGKHRKAVDVGESALDCYADLRQTDSYRSTLGVAVCSGALALSNAAQNEFTKARTFVDLAKTQLQTLPEPADPKVCQSMADAWTNVSTAQSYMGESSSALISSYHSLRLRRHVAAFGSAEISKGLSASLVNLSGDLLSVGKYDESRTAAAEAMTLLENLFQSDNERYRLSYARSKAMYANACVGCGQLQEAIKWFLDAAITLRPDRNHLSNADATVYLAVLDNLKSCLESAGTSANEVEAFLSKHGLQFGCA